VLLLEAMLEFEHKDALVRAVVAALKPAGRFAFTLEEGPPLTPAERAAMPDGETVWLTPLDEMRACLDRAGLAVTWHEDHSRAHGATARALAGAFAADAENIASQIVEARAACRHGKCESVEFTNVPCFVGELDAQVEVEGLGTVTVDVAYGGMWYAIADAQALGFEITPEEARDLSFAGERIRAAARDQLECVHPENPAIAGVSIVQIAEPWRGVGEVTKNAVVVAPGRLDRSATGTGLSARLAVLHARGQMQVGDAMTHASAIGSTFDGRIVEETQLGARPAIVPAIRGSAWLTGITQVLIDPSDPFPEGYVLSDTWGISGLDTQ
jgi:hypothetical protein